jgi:hypothetical protein
MQTKTKKTDGKNSISKNQLVNWKLYIILLIASIFGNIAVLPYTLTLQGGLLQNSPVPLYVILAAQINQSMILFAVVIFIGLYLPRKWDLDFPSLKDGLKAGKLKVI